ncbi:MAG TPA: DUF1657 domain-containing protein [Natronincola sp.]|nr:DUF1657 domain-containing protein [Natronincola sp.]
MTTKSRIEQTVAGAHSLAGQLKSCAIDTDVPAVKDMFNTMAQDVEDMIPKLQGRLKHVGKEEPQFQ